ncbi:Uncharacterised protein [Bordetella pertussis]|nr:Uncharacterised protein [Bordetella pertussis]
MNSADSTDIEFVRTRSSSPASAEGKPATIPAKIRIEMPLPSPRSVICSPSHMTNMVPVTSVTTVVKRNNMPGSMTSPGWDSSATEMPTACTSASTTVP